MMLNKMLNPQVDVAMNMAAGQSSSRAGPI